LADLSFGAARGQQRERNKAALDDFTAALEIAPFDAAAAVTYGAVRAMLEVRGAGMLASRSLW
jgi:tRNA(fMet)-specific endonuclease VapC